MPEKELFPAGACLIFGATGGIGKHVALGFAEAGTDIALVWRSKEQEAKELAAQIEALGCKASLHQCDVLENDACLKTINEAISQHKQIHTMVWGAGPLVEQVYLSEMTLQQWKQAINVEVHGFLQAAQACLPHMREKGGGSLIHLGSAGHTHWPEKDVLSVAPKAANEALIKGIAREEGRHNIRANSILVGVIEAGMFLELSKQGVFDEAWTTEVQKNLGLKRWGQPEEIGHAAVFLASSKAAYITGQKISVSGGYGL